MAKLIAAKIKTYLGLVTDGDGKPLPEEGYITYGLPDDEEGEITVRGKNAANIAAKIVDLLNSNRGAS